MTGFILATANPDKAREISEILGDAVCLTPRPGGVPPVAETGVTLEDNARLKALALSEATGSPAIADDTGLEVDALGGAPGVHSARYAGEDASYADNVAKLAQALAGARGPQARRARFRTVAIAVWPGGDEVVAEGTVEGWIAEGPKGINGFGYDPVFVADETGGVTFAELDSAAKHTVSHRGRAFRALAEALAWRSDGPVL
ncbi:MAG: RdgB/HAM1 family non-canonical purine NTP pyrophosphatase [Actinomycetota bacterium]|nr:RdgB/HAM1 family non-canonical purine NTP pyrophosphatase [Actinomycetota bacterium]